MKRTRRRESKAEYTARQHFNEAVLEHPCQFSSRAGHFCEGERDAHHLIPKQFIRFRLANAPNFVSVLYSPLIGAPLCRLAHELVEKRLDYIYWDELTPECIEYVGSLPDFMLLRLEEESPKREVRDVA